MRSGRFVGVGWPATGAQWVGAAEGQPCAISGLMGIRRTSVRRWRELHPEVIDEFQRQIPMGRFGDPEDLWPYIWPVTSPDT